MVFNYFCDVANAAFSEEMFLFTVKQIIFKSEVEG